MLVHQSPKSHKFLVSSAYHPEPSWIESAHSEGNHPGRSGPRPSPRCGPAVSVGFESPAKGAMHQMRNEKITWFF